MALVAPGSGFQASFSWIQIMINYATPKLAFIKCKTHHKHSPLGIYCNNPTKYIISWLDNKCEMPMVLTFNFGVTPLKWKLPINAFFISYLWCQATLQVNITKKYNNYTYQIVVQAIFFCFYSKMKKNNEYVGVFLNFCPVWKSCQLRNIVVQSERGFVKCDVTSFLLYTSGRRNIKSWLNFPKYFIY
jgi:hypothetical protein